MIASSCFLSMSTASGGCFSPCSEPNMDSRITDVSVSNASVASEIESSVKISACIVSSKSATSFLFISTSIFSSFASTSASGRDRDSTLRASVISSDAAPSSTSTFFSPASISASSSRKAEVSFRDSLSRAPKEASTSANVTDSRLMASTTLPSCSLGSFSVL